MFIYLFQFFDILKRLSDESLLLENREGEELQPRKTRATHFLIMIIIVGYISPLC